MAIGIKSRGLGWLTDVIVILGPIFLLAGLYGVTHTKSGLVWGFAIPGAFLVTGLANYLVGHALNVRDGDAHTWAGAPMERASAASFVFMLISIAAVVGHFTSAIIGWVVGIVLVVGCIVSFFAVVGKVSTARRREERAIAVAARGETAAGSSVTGPGQRLRQQAPPDRPSGR